MACFLILRIIHEQPRITFLSGGQAQIFDRLGNQALYPKISPIMEVLLYVGSPQFLSLAGPLLINAWLGTVRLNRPQYIYIYVHIKLFYVPGSVHKLRYQAKHNSSQQSVWLCPRTRRAAEAAVATSPRSMLRAHNCRVVAL